MTVYEDAGPTRCWARAIVEARNRRLPLHGFLIAQAAEGYCPPGYPKGVVYVTYHPTADGQSLFAVRVCPAD